VKIAFVFNRKTNESVEQAEFDTTETITCIHNALQSGGHEVHDVEMTLENSVSQWITRLAEVKPQIIFNTAEGYYGIGRESLGPTIFEQLQIPYVGSGPYGCFLTLDKFLTKQMVASRNVPVVEGYFVNSVEELQSIAREVVFPAFVKPNYEGSSKGITSRSLCRDVESLLSYGNDCLKLFPQGILIERFIAGRDVSVPFVAGLGESGVLEPLEYVFASQSNVKDTSEAIYDYDLKNFADETVSVRCPAAIDPNTRATLIEMMRRIVPAVGVVDFARADFRISPEGEIYFLEINALPSLQPGAGVFEATKLLNLSYDQTILKIVEAAVQRLKLGGKASRSPRRLRTVNPRIGLVYNLKRKDPSDPDYEHEAEFDSQKTVDALRNTIEKFGCHVVPVEATKSLSETLKEQRVDVVFNIAEGTNKRAREAQVPAVCDLLGIEHTGSDATCLAITLDKAITKRLLSQDGLLTPNYRLYQGGKMIDTGLRFPVIVKPNHEGTSKGIGGKSVVNNQEDLQNEVASQWKRFQEPILCEEYIEGREYTIGILGNSTLKLLGPMEIRFTDKAGQFPVYSFEAKQDNPADNPIFSVVCPVSLGRETDRKVASFAKKAFHSLGCRDVARIDFRVDNTGNIYFIEINPLPGLAPGFSDLVILAEKSGMSYEGLIKRILTPAIQRWRNLERTKHWQ
jgi:D-alanine-D-alanine ligase